MRTNERLNEVWQRGGPFIGRDASNAYVTVQLDWLDLVGTTGYRDILRPTVTHVGNSGPRGLPLRWYQRADNCVDVATEILTTRGWLHVHDLAPGDQALGLNPATGCSEWTDIECVNLSEGPKKVMRLDTIGHSSVTTANHRWLTTRSGQPTWTTSEAMTGQDRIPACAPPSSCPSTPIHPDAFVELVAWFWTEGSWRRGGCGGSLSQSDTANPANVRRIRRCFAEVLGDPGPMTLGRSISPEVAEQAVALVASGMTLRAAGAQLGISHCAVLKYCRKSSVWSPQWNESRKPTGVIEFNFSRSFGERLAAIVDRKKVVRMEFLRSLTRAQLDLFIDTSIEADGCRNPIPRLCQVEKERSDLFQAACTLAGRPTRASLKDGMHQVSVLTRRAVAPLSSVLYHGRGECAWEETDELMWCPTTRLGTWLARREGTVYFTGNSQREQLLPNVRSIAIDRSIDADAATCDLTLVNTKLWPNGQIPADANELGQPGYYWPYRGMSPEAEARWGQTVNEWAEVLVPDSIIRTFEGYGDRSKTLEEALADEDVQLTGVWLIDKVTGRTGSTLTVHCRDMAKLLIDQMLYPPLIPNGKYPLKYYRWHIDNVGLNAGDLTQTTTVDIAGGDKRTAFVDSAVDHWYPNQDAGVGIGYPGDDLASGGFVLHGHQAIECLDGNTDTFCLSVGNSYSDAPWATDWWQFDCGETMNAVYIHPWAGGYTAYISVLENGAWQGDQTIPYDPSYLFGSQPYAADTGAGIPYVDSFGVNWEEPIERVLPRAYAAQQVRVTFRNEAESQWGPWYYRCGMREFRIRGVNGVAGSSSSSTMVLQPTFYANANIFDPDDLDTVGYITSSDFGQIDAFGDARVHAVSPGDSATNSDTSGLAFTKTRLGYYQLRKDGTVSCYGDAVWRGSPYTPNLGLVPNGYPNVFADIIVTPSGDGYWVTRWDGTIYSYGDAATYAPVTGLGNEVLFRTSGNPVAQGLFLLSSSGTVSVRGTATHFGNLAAAASFLAVDTAADIASNIDATGYWILTTAGTIQAFGAAVLADTPLMPALTTDARGRYLAILPAPSGDGYLVMRGDGSIFSLGTVDNFGGPVPGTTAQIRSPGNYTDWSDIVRDLALWSGFLLYDETAPDNEPAHVYGNIESTGSWSDLPLPADMFDKKPVMDPLIKIKEAVGYTLRVDEEGGLRFETPNWWSPGNFDFHGNRLDTILEIDERVQLTELSSELNDEAQRSAIIISSSDPDQALSSTITTRIEPSTAKNLRGLNKPAMWVNSFFQKKSEQELMAELIALQIWFQGRLTQISCWANPNIGVDDQVRIIERETSSSYIYYVRGVRTNHDLAAGSYTAELTTHWLGDAEKWAIDSGTTGSANQGTWGSAATASLPSSTQRFTLSPATVVAQTSPETVNYQAPPPLSLPPSSPLQINSVDRVVYCTKAPHEAIPHGVPSGYDWYSGPTVQRATPGADQVAWFWGQVYLAADGVLPTNTRVALRDCRLYVLANGVWVNVQTQGAQSIEGGAYPESFVGSNATPNVRTETDGTLSVKLQAGYNFHFWINQWPRPLLPAGTITGVYTTVQAKLVTDNLAVPADSNPRLLVNTGSDWYSGPTSSVGAGGVEPGAGQGRFCLVTPQWQAFDFCTFGESAIRATPPPVSLAGSGTGT